MTVPSPPPLEFEEQGQTLRRLFECVSIGRRYAPRLTLSGFQILIYLAIQTLDRTHLDLPTNASLAEAVKLSRSGVSRILESLSSNGRPKFRTDTNHEGYGLIDSNEHIGGSEHLCVRINIKGQGMHCQNDAGVNRARDRLLQPS